MSCSDTRHSTELMCVHAARRTGLRTGQKDEVAEEWKKLHSEELHQMLLDRSDEGG